MYATLEASEFKQAVSHARRFAKGRNAMPTLGSLYLEPRQGALRFLGTDLECACAYDAPAERAEGGPVVIPERRLWDVARAARKGQTVELRSTSDGSVRITVGGRVYTVQATPAEEFPSVAIDPGPAAPKPARFDVADVAALFGQTVYAASRDETRYHLNGVLLEDDGETVTAVATDGHRLALVTRGAPKGGRVVPGRRHAGNAEGRRPHVWSGPRSDVPAVLVPFGLADALAQVSGKRRPLASELAWSVTGTPGAGTIFARLGPVAFAARPVSGDFPSYPQVLPPEDAGPVWTVERERLAEVAKAAGAVAPERSYAIRLRANGALEVSASSPDAGEYREELPVLDCSEPGADVTLGLNARYLRDALAHLGGERVRIALRGVSAPVRIDPEDGSGALNVTMPMRL